MAEEITEVEKSIGITPERVLQSISENESWWEKFQDIMKNGYPVNDFLTEAISVLNKMEESAKIPYLPEFKEEAEKIKALWVISAPGTYFQAEKNDRYKGKKWALWNDRQRINYAFKVGRRLAEIKMGHPVSENWVSAEEELSEYAPFIVYNGRSDEDLALEEAVKTPWLRIPARLMYPAKRVHIILPIKGFDPNTSTFDNIKTFRLPPGTKIEEGDEIGIVIHAPQAMRFLYALANLDEIVPKGAEIRMLPLPTPTGGYPEYPLQELRGMVNYRFIANPPIISDSPYPYKI